MFSRLAVIVVLSICSCGVLSAAVSSGVWLDVPFVKQEKNGCGAASVAMVMQYWLKQQGRSSESADATQIHHTLYVSDADGVYASAMERYFQEHQFRTFSFRGEWDDLEQHLQKGRPLIVALKPSWLNRTGPALKSNGAPLANGRYWLCRSPPMVDESRNLSSYSCLWFVYSSRPDFDLRSESSS